VAKSWARFWTVPLVLFGLGAADALGPLCRLALAQQQAASENTSWWGSITSPVKKGFSKIGEVFSPSSKPAAKPPGTEDDAISLKNTSKPGPGLYVAVAHLYEQQSKFADAEQQYLLALKEKPDYLPALLGYAQLEEQRGQPDEALRLYQRAAKAYPRDAAVYNNMGLYYAKLGRANEAVGALSHAVELAPKNPRYRNNIATVLVDQGRLREAFMHLQETHGEAAAYYNLGFLLNKKGQTQAAMQHFALALKADPSMVAAQRWLDYLQRSVTRERLPQHPASSGVKIISERVREEASAPAPEPSPRRLPPIPSSEAGSEGPSLPGISRDRSAVPAAPMPPPSRGAVQSWPRTE
jgi:tetratricopeptide (TPR) repeat protein